MTGHLSCKSYLVVTLTQYGSLVMSKHTDESSELEPALLMGSSIGAPPPSVKVPL
jgi:hypothetical protein